MSQNYRNPKKMKSQIHCPVSGCLYALGSERHFSEKKLLNQHIAKVHAEKKFSCAKCQKSFGADWYRKNHEQTCGIEWKCYCGSVYSSRLSLLTHARRTQHKLPDSMMNHDKVKQKINLKQVDNPVIVLIQPIIQNVTCIQPPQNPVVTPRRILPKTTQPVLLTLSLPSNVVATTPAQNVSPVIPEQTQEIFFNSAQPFSPNGSVQSTTSQAFSNANDSSTADTSKKLQKTVATQTINEISDNSSKSRQSQASQCSRRKPKSTKVGIESTHTQTAESAVVKIKKKRSRRKSVAITTEPSLLTDNMSFSENSFWPGLKDFLQIGDVQGVRLFKNSTSTQTSTINNDKVLCDSETLTDEDLLKLTWEEAMKQKGSGSVNSGFQMATDFGADDSLPALPVVMDNNTLPDLNIFSNSSSNEFTEIKTSVEENALSQTDLSEKNASSENSSVFSVFDNSAESHTNNKAQIPPTLSDIHTQTMASAVLDFNLLANMETQTTDDFNFSDLEFSDTETQTPWEDLPCMDDSPLQADQLSIEIQTDFPAFPSGLNVDPFELINSVDMHHMMPGCSNKESLGVNTETQTLDRFYFPQFTNSESQTLDMPDFMFESLSSQNGQS